MKTSRLIQITIFKYSQHTAGAEKNHFLTQTWCGTRLRLEGFHLRATTDAEQGCHQV